MTAPGITNGNLPRVGGVVDSAVNIAYPPIDETPLPLR
jgi:hypothetical protein